MTSNEVIETIKLAVEIGLVDPTEPMFSDKYANVWSEMIGVDWQDKVKLAIYEVAAKQVEMIDTFGTIHLN
jgi:hypothetical protein